MCLLFKAQGFRILSLSMFLFLFWGHLEGFEKPSFQIQSQTKRCVHDMLWTDAESGHYTTAWSIRLDKWSLCASALAQPQTSLAKCHNFLFSTY